MKPETKLADTSKLDVSVRPLREDDLNYADHIMRLAFGTFIGLPEPTQFMGDADYVRTRWRANPAAAFAAEVNGSLAGSNFATNWGSVGFFGPLTVHPDFWDRGIAKHLMKPIMDLFDAWGTRHAGLFTFPQSQKHVGLYQHFGFRPRFLTMLMSKAVTNQKCTARWTTLSDADVKEKAGIIADGRALTSEIYEGLDITSEIEAVDQQNLGATVLLWDDDALRGLAVCHAGPGTEAGSGA
jgi:GNAT superfamily N-acetyltransferase